MPPAVTWFRPGAIIADVPVGLYLSVPFCRTKCTYCNFASDVFSQALFDRYLKRICADLEGASAIAKRMGGRFEPTVDSIYLGGGTPSLLDIAQLERLFVTISQNFSVLPGAEVTVECAPGTLNPSLLVALQRCGVNRVSLGVQSFVDREAASVGRLHTRQAVLDDIAHLRAAGIANINLDLIAGLPHQTGESWEVSLEETVAAETPHVSVYLLEVDQDSRLGRELIAGGTRYHAHFVPGDDLAADMYSTACERLESAGIPQYEISNFARNGFQSRHNLKYWTRQPYMGFGVDAHSMLPAEHGGTDSVRYSTPDSLEGYLANGQLTQVSINRPAALEETFFLGLRLNRGLDLRGMARQFGDAGVSPHLAAVEELTADGLLLRQGDGISLTPRGRLLSNEVFARFLTQPQES